jgi:hypothetical protein
MTWLQFSFRFGDLKLPATPSLAGRGIIPGKGVMLTMKVTPRTTQKMARQAFGLLLELRERENAHQLLTQAIALLEMLAREKEVNAAPIMLSVRVMQLRKS